MAVEQKIKITGTSASEIKHEGGGQAERDTMSSLVQDMLSGRYSTEELLGLFDYYVPEKLSPEALAGCLDGVLASASYTIDASRFDKPIVVPAGTGGDGKGTVNITTMAGFIMAASGRCVVPLYGNRKASGKFGKMDILESLGIQIDGDADRVRYSLANIGISPVFARNSHPGARHVAEARVKYGKPTLFNLVMPLAAPVTTEASLLIGSANADQLENMGRMITARGVKRAIFVHNMDHHLDELATGVNKVVLVDDGKVTPFTVVVGESEDIHLLQADGDDAFTRIFQDVLDPSQSSEQLSAIRRVVALNAACGFFLVSEPGTDFSKSFPYYYNEALALIQTGKAQEKLNEARNIV